MQRHSSRRVPSLGKSFLAQPTLPTQMPKPPSVILLSVILFNALAVPNSEARKLPVTRVLTNTDGKKIDATVLANDGSKVKIRRTSDGKEFSLELTKLIQEDQDFLNEPTVQEKLEPIPVERPPKEEKPEIRDWKLKQFSCDHGREWTHHPRTLRGNPRE